jgi:broad specificity phosphatase PhoE
VSEAIWLARHGETDANAEGRVQGSIDPPLNDRGREHARELAAAVRGLGLAALYTSQLGRARETAAIVAEAIGLEPRVDERFAESHRGEWEGRLHVELRAEDPDGWLASFDGSSGFRFPGGESLAEHRARVLAALEDVARGPLPALVVCHGGSIRRALEAWRPELVPPAGPVAISNGGLFEVRVGVTRG